MSANGGNAEAGFWRPVGESCQGIGKLTSFVDAGSMNQSLIELRAVADADVLLFFDHASDSRAVSMAAPARTISNWPTFKQQWDHIRSDEEFICRSVFLHGKLAGYIAKFEQEAVPSISYWFAREFWGQGLARAALSLFLENIAERPLHARVASGNKPSLKVLVANGFTKIGTSGYFSEALDKKIEEIVLRLDT